MSAASLPEPSGSPAAPAAPVGRWTTARVAEVQRVGERLVRLRLDIADRVDHWPGQHYVLRLRAADGYTAQRAYSVASDPADPLVELMIECLPGGEVSGFLREVVRSDDVLEVRGPIGGWFTWTGETRAAALVGGTGVVPVVAMVRHARRLGVLDRLRVVAVGRHLDALPYADELLDAGAFVALTRENFEVGGVSRVAAPPYPEEVHEALAPLGGPEAVEAAYVCGSVGFATFAQRLLGEVGVRLDRVRVEQFGATT